MPDQPAHHDHHYKRTIIIISIAIVIIIVAAVIIRGIFPSKTERMISNDPAMAQSAAFFKEHASNAPISDAEMKEAQIFFKGHSATSISEVEVKQLSELQTQ